MSAGARGAAAALIAGLLFGAGLVISGMTQPRKVIGFLDVFGHWDASLMFVMLGAVFVHALAYRLARKQSRPLLAPAFATPPANTVDARLVLGAAIFGIGWGLSGYCPGPALVSMPSGQLGLLTFIACMLLGSWLAGGGKPRQQLQ